VVKPTPSQTVGPFFGFALPFPGDADAGGPLRIEGQVLDGAGEPVGDAVLEISEGEQFARCRTDPEGVYHFRVREPVDGYFEVAVFARGLLRHLRTRIYMPGREADVPRAVEPSRRGTMVARADGPVLRFDVRLQGEAETVFLD
jgi:protocatechuate 3,4-dioxygenase beta subunit